MPDAHADAHDLPSEVDVLVQGTGLVQSLIACACAKRGESVLVLDENNQYGDAFGAFEASAGAFDAFTSACATNAITFGRWTTDAGERPSTRGYNVDLCAPRATLGADAFTDAMIRSGAHKYLAFKAIEKTFVYGQGGFRVVASDRREMFADASMTGAEKRALMRFLKRTRILAMRDDVLKRRSGTSGEETNVPAGAPGSEWGEGAFGEDDAGAEAAEALRVEPNETMESYLRRQGLSDALAATVTYGLALQTRAGSDAGQGMEDLKTYALSVGKYGPQFGACLIPTYGTGDLPQAFCRAGAVSGATYVLRQGVQRVDIDSNAVATVVSKGGQEIRVKRFVGAAPERSDGPRLVHVACVLDGPVVRDFGEVLIVFPPGTVREAQSTAVRALQMSSNTGCCPDGVYLLYLSNVVDEHEDDAYSNVNAALDVLVSWSYEETSTVVSVFDDGAQKPIVMWGTMHSRRCGIADDVECVASNAAQCPFPDELLTYKGAVDAAERAFAKLYGDEEEMFPPVEILTEQVESDED